MMEPFETVSIQSIIAENTNAPGYKEKPFQVTAMLPRKTFMEKLILLHEKFLTGMIEGDAAERQSRHLSDLRQMKNKGILKEVLNDPELYTRLIEHRRYYTKLKGVDYDSMQLRQLLFLPPWDLIELFRKDYESMLEQMIYGTPPGFDALIDELRELNKELASLGHQKKIAIVIETGAKQLSDSRMKGDFLSTNVVYAVSPSLPDGPDNITISFCTEFISKEDGLIFHRMKVL